MAGYTSDDANYYGNTYSQLENGQSPDITKFGDYNPQSSTTAGANTGASPDDSPVKLTDIPTSSLDASRPRTVAAGYQEYAGSRKGGQAGLGKMTVMFRDGTLYNYYDVTPGEWSNFKESISKGSPWLNRGFPNGKQQVDGLFISKPRGLASLANVAPDVLENIYQVARVAQVRFATKRATHVKMHEMIGLGQVAVSSTKRVVRPNSAGIANAPKNAARKVRAAAKAANPNANNGKNPYKK
jgi:hypothetical protein